MKVKVLRTFTILPQGMTAKEGQILDLASRYARQKAEQGYVMIVPVEAQGPAGPAYSKSNPPPKNKEVQLPDDGVFVNSPVDDSEKSNDMHKESRWAKLKRKWLLLE